MHKGVILLTKAKNREEAKAKAEEFLEPYGDGDVWDWYVIGGRWSGTLDNYSPEDDPNKKEKCTLCNGTGMRTDRLGCEERQRDPAYTCNGCGGKGITTTWPTSWDDHDGDISPCSLPGVADKVREWGKDWEEKALKEVAESRKHFTGNKQMLAYLKKKEAIIEGDEFSFDSNVFDIDEMTNTLPDNLHEYWAVMVDLHN